MFDPTKTSYRDILAFFFQIHDPSTLNRQGNDIGSSYRSAIFPLSPEQEQVARDTIADVDASGLWPGKAVTTIEPAGPFWEAEPEHQDYLITYPERVHVPLPARGMGAAEARRDLDGLVRPHPDLTMGWSRDVLQPSVFFRVPREFRQW